MIIDALIPPQRVRLDAECTSKKRLLESISQLIIEPDAPSQLDSTRVFETLIAREKLGSTAIGRGIAIPHGRVEGLSRPRGAFVRLKQGVDFDALDHQPVDLVFALLVPEGADSEHLNTLAQLAQLLSSPRYAPPCAKPPHPKPFWPFWPSMSLRSGA
jgi:PTS system nitrogen regulatory IIA component